MSETESCFYFRNQNLIASSKTEEKREKTKVTNIRHERWILTIDPHRDEKDNKRILWIILVTILKH